MTVFTKTYNPPPFDKGEILRYSGAKESTPETDKLIDECIDEIKNKLIYKVCYAIFPVSFSDGEVNLSFTKTKSDSLRKNLAGCKEIALFAATVGLEIDRCIAKYGRISPSKALIFQAIGAERIESLCDVFCNEIKHGYINTAPRFSPGYGDFPLDVQKDIFRVLEPHRRIGLTLNDSMLMTPSKSVTAIVGIGHNRKTKEHNCSCCDKTDCFFRR